ncbi:hypothetical protein [Luteimonas aquatica]|uniref:hypothetical protein n=1 Tax=Luteimonas aquatica TaxID=450364 RepID=UPI001F56533C|nr:hypothetical protein [Luteimonas aquatica]
MTRLLLASEKSLRALAQSRPEGQRAGMPAVFRSSQEGESENPLNLSVLGLTCREGVFLWFVSFDAFQKK